MTHPAPELLAGLALDDDGTDDDRRHVASCGVCAETVAQLRRTLDLARSADPLEAPHPDLWRRIEDALDADEAQEGAAGRSASTAGQPISAAGQPTRTAGHPTATGGPDPRPVDDSANRPHASRPRRSRQLAWTAAAAVLGVLVGMGAAISFWRAPGSDVTTIATAQLDTLDTRQARGTAELQRTGDGLDLRIDATSLDAGTGYLEVWLLNTDGKRMVSVGVLREPGSDTFPVSQTLLDNGYVVVDVSREGYDDKPQHSGDSLARGQLVV